MVEGIDGCGKSTQVQRVAAAWGARATFEPGGTTLGSDLRRLILREGQPPVPWAEALLMAADRAQHVAVVIEPALAEGTDVVSDRFWASTVAYQGYGRQLDLGALRSLTEIATGGLRPDVTVLLDLPVAMAHGRRGTTPDRMEAMDLAFFERVRSGYLALAADDPSGWAVVDATGSLEEVTHAVDDVLRARGIT